MPSSLINAIRAVNELGFQPVALNALYRFGLATGHYRRLESREQRLANGQGGIGKRPLNKLFTFPTPAELLAILGAEGKAELISQAEEIMAGKARLFGDEPVELTLTLPGKLEHWTVYETGKSDLRLLTPDVKFLWEPARFGWVFTLGRAYWLTGVERAAETFWNYFELFTDSNPAYLGLQWMSGQEVALRLMAFVWAGQAFAKAPASTAERLARLAESVAEHARRLPPTLVYARSQQNNHLLAEAAGLFTAGLALPDHPDALKWQKMGWEWLNRGLREQIDGYGEYSQHSTNYHRMMLQLVLWANALISSNDLNRYYRWPRQTNDAITRSIHWLLALLDPDTGRTPNLGANDGGYIFPLVICSFSDYRPVLYAAARAFLNYDLPHGPWDELSLWFDIPLVHKKYVQFPRYIGDQVYGKDSWAYLRTAQFTTRPSHADQLHLDLWWRGLNIAQDAGTYTYNAEPPWDNGLTMARVHNTVTVNGRDQMDRAGRFLYLGWVNAYRQGGFEPDSAVLQRVRGRYRNPRQSYRHTRLVTVFSDGHWRIEDEIISLRWLHSLFPHPPSVFRLHWLLPDWEWQAEKQETLFEMRLKSPQGWVTLTLRERSQSDPHDSRITLFRAGEPVYGAVPASADPTRGWVSPTYGVKVPALSLALETSSADDVQFTSEYIFP